MTKGTPLPSDEKRWQEWWKKNNIYGCRENTGKKKFYVLDMFPYPSGAGLHVGHPLGYIASDIYARYKRHCGYEVLHPMGFDSFGLPAEQYAIQTGKHPALTTKENIERYRQQLNNIGLSFDWNREVQTSSPEFYRWTQWLFIQMYESWVNPETGKAETIHNLIKRFSQNGNKGLTEYFSNVIESFTAQEWNTWSEKRKSEVLMNYRLAYCGEGLVNWCPALGTVLANDEVKDGLSERGGHPVVKKKMKQWYLRITAYAERLLKGLDKLDWSESIKESQRNWIGKSSGAYVHFPVENKDSNIEVFTTRPDTLFGVTFLVVSPEYERILYWVGEEERKRLKVFIDECSKKSERERLAEFKDMKGVFTGVYAVHPFTQERIPVWMGDYVVGGYGTGAIMAVPGHDSRDHRFAGKYQLPVVKVVEGPEVEKEANESKEGYMINSSFLNGLQVKDAIEKIIEELEKNGKGRRAVQYRLRDAVFGRQRYWGEPIPVYYDEEEIPRCIDENDLPLKLPEIDQYLPTSDGQPPLARAREWKYKDKYSFEQTTMPGWAGSSWYFLRYMDPHNTAFFCDPQKSSYWGPVDVYVGGSEHATGHLLYARFWNMFLYDRGWVSFEEPFRKLINQGMIQGTSCIVYRDVDSNTLVSAGLKNKYKYLQPLHVDVSLEKNGSIDPEALRKWRDDFAEARFDLEEGKLIPDHQVEKMSKRWHNVVNPDDICREYGADTLRLYEMFLGPIELSKPWNTRGIQGVYHFLKRFRRLYFPEESSCISEAEPTFDEYKILHRTIKKVREDIERWAFNTCISSLMIGVNELTELRCHKRKILEPLTILLSPFAPHLAEELWQEALGHTQTVTLQPYPQWDEQFLKENIFHYPVSFNGKTRLQIPFPANANKETIEKEVLDKEELKKYLQGKSVRKVIVVPGRIINIVTD